MALSANKIGEDNNDKATQEQASQGIRIKLPFFCDLFHQYVKQSNEQIFQFNIKEFPQKESQWCIKKLLEKSNYHYQEIRTIRPSMNFTLNPTSRF